MLGNNHKGDTCLNLNLNRAFILFNGEDWTDKTGEIRPGSSDMPAVLKALWLEYWPPSKQEDLNYSTWTHL